MVSGNRKLGLALLVLVSLCGAVRAVETPEAAIAALLRKTYREGTKSFSARDGEKLRVAKDKVEADDGQGGFRDLGFLPPPAGITYENCQRDGEGHLAVQLGGTGNGFNFKFRHGPVVIAGRQEWTGDLRPNFTQLAPSPSGRGFVGLDDAGSLFYIDPPTRTNRKFTAQPLASGLEVLVMLHGQLLAVSKNGASHALIPGTTKPVGLAVITQKDAPAKTWDMLRTHLAGLPPQLAVAPPPKAAARYPVTFEQFSTLVRTAVANVPELRNLWVMPGIRDRIYLGGGGLRGLLRWVSEHIRAGFVKPADFERPPSIDKLIQEGADKDIWITDVRDEPWLDANGFRDWDGLEEAFHKASVKAGGAAIEKLRVRPDAIDDPYDALRDWYNGEVTFKLASVADFESTRDVLKHKNTQTALAIRFLRFALESSKSAAVSAGSLEALRALAVRERKLPTNNYWISKGLRKLLVAALAVPGGAKGMAASLTQPGLLSNLLENGYTMAGAVAEDPGFAARLKDKEHREILAGSFPPGEHFKAVRFFLTDYDFKEGHVSTMPKILEIARTEKIPRAEVIEFLFTNETFKHLAGCDTCRSAFLAGYPDFLQDLAALPGDSSSSDDKITKGFGPWRRRISPGCRGDLTAMGLNY